MAFLKPREVLIAGAVSFLRSLVVSAADLLFCLWISIGSSLSTRCGEARIFDGLQSPLIVATAGLTSLLHAAFGRTPVLGRRCRVGCAKRLMPTVVPLLLAGMVLAIWRSATDAEVCRWHQPLICYQRMCGRGASDEAAIVQWLAEFLPTKGVPPERASARATLAIKKLGVSALRQALRAANPWVQLKQAANSLSKPFGWVEHSELQAHVTQRAESAFGLRPQPRSKKPTFHRAEPVQLHLEPVNLIIAAGSFVDANDVAIPQMTFHEVIPDSRGLAVAKVEQVQLLLHSKTNVSVHALGVLTIEKIPLSLRAEAVVTDLQSPALYAPTKEPILALCSLLSIGDTTVQPKQVDGQGLLCGSAHLHLSYDGVRR